MNEALDAAIARGTEQRCGAHDVGLHECHRSMDRAIDMTLRRKVHDRFDAVIRDHARDERSIADVAFDELVIDTRKRRKIACVCQRIEYDESIVRMARAALAHEVAA